MKPDRHIPVLMIDTYLSAGSRRQMLFIHTSYQGQHEMRKSAGMFNIFHCTRFKHMSIIFQVKMFNVIDTSPQTAYTHV